MASAAGLTNAATAEFLRAPDGSTYFLEVNTRLQVEHGVTELVTGLDLVGEQFDLAAGRPLSEAAITAAAQAHDPTAHAIEVRLTAEDPGRDFAPTPGRIRHWVMPAGPGVRVDTGVGAGDRIPPEYDNLIAKVMVVAEDRAAALRQLVRALDETEIGVCRPRSRSIASWRPIPGSGPATSRRIGSRRRGTGRRTGKLGKAARPRRPRRGSRRPPPIE